MAALRAMLLDIDGTLIDSNDAHAWAWVEVGREFGYDVAYDEVRPLIGMGGDRVIPRLTGLAEDSPEGKRIKERHGEVFRREYLPRLRPFEGTHALLERFRADGLELVVATSASRRDMRALLEQAGIAELIEGATSSSDVEESKPDPDVVRAALREAGCAAAEAIMLGDTPYDVEAANDAGVEIIAFRCGGWMDDELRGAAAIYEGPEELLERYAESPVGRRLS